MFCPKCGKEQQSGAAFCAACGVKLENENTFQSNNSGFDLKRRQESCSDWQSL